METCELHTNQGEVIQSEVLYDSVYQVFTEIGHLLLCVSVLYYTKFHF